MTSPVTPDEPESARSEDREAAPDRAWLVNQYGEEAVANNEARGDLSSAWEAAEAALPEGWVISGLNPGGPVGHWEAGARGQTVLRRDPMGLYPETERGVGDSPTLALQALTTRLLARSTEQGGAG